MKKEKQVRTYQRRTKSGKMVTVKAHTATYDAAEKAKEMAKKKGSGGELEEKKKAKVRDMPDPHLDMKDYLDELKKGLKKDEEQIKDSTKKESTKKLKRPIGSGTLGPEKRKAKKDTTTKKDSGEISSADFKEWYHGTGSDADKRVAKMLKAKLGRAGYKKLEDEAIDNYSSRGHLKLFKSLGSISNDSTPAKSSKVAPVKPSAIHPHDMYEYSAKDKKRMDSLLPKISKMQEVWQTKYGSRANTPAAMAYQKKLNSLEDEYQKLINSSKKETSAYTKYKKDSAEWNKYNTTQKKKQDSASKKEEKQKYMNMAEKKGLSYVGTKDGAMIFHKNGKPYMAERGKITSLNVPKTVKDYVSKRVENKDTAKKGETRTNSGSSGFTKKDFEGLIKGLSSASHSSFGKPVRVISRKDGSMEANAPDYHMWDRMKNAGWKNVDKVFISGGSSNYVSPDGKYQAVVSPFKTRIFPLKDGAKAKGYSMDSVIDALMGKD